MPLLLETPVEGRHTGRAIKPAEGPASDPSAPDTGAGSVRSEDGASFTGDEAVKPIAPIGRSSIPYAPEGVEPILCGQYALLELT